jgi:unsaturated chondroitin disaccharide hydrolase
MSVVVGFLELREGESRTPCTMVQAMDIVPACRYAESDGMSAIDAAPIVTHPSGGATVTMGAMPELLRAWELCLRKSRRNIGDLADNLKSWSWADDGDYSKFNEGFFEIGNWTSSFFTGMALLGWRHTRDVHFLEQTLRLRLPYMEKAVVRHLDMHHDAGFLYTLYSVAFYKSTGDKEHRDVGVAAAEALHQRFNPQGNFIRAWGRLDGKGEQVVDGRPTENMAIIDGMMNLPLLFWASLESGDPKYHDAAVRSADTTLKCFVRPDDSVCHAYRFDLESGDPLGPENICGHSVDSHWARGTAWAIYGFALAHKYTRHQRYLEVAERLARKFLSLLDSEVVPVWDFKLPASEPIFRDSSALAIAVCGLQELARCGAANPTLVDSVRPMLLRLCSEHYLDARDDCRGILKSAYGNRVAYSSWGDYFLMEAVGRELGVSDAWW